MSCFVKKEGILDGLSWGVMVTGAVHVLAVIAEAGSGYHYLGRGAERIVIHPAG